MRILKRNAMKSSEIRLGPMMVDRQTGRLRDAGGQEVQLRHMSREVLIFLLQYKGEVVSRQALVEAVWKTRSTSDDTIAQTIADIRRALGDRSKRIIETVPRVGYRLAAPLRKDAPSARIATSWEETVAKGPDPQQDVAPVIAVLPFADLGICGYPSAALRTSLAEAIITDLARHPEMVVLTRVTLTDFGTQLRADYLVTGTLCSDGHRARVGLRLVVAEAAECLWVDEMDFDLSEFMQVVRSIGRLVANVVGAKIIGRAEARMDRGELSAMLIENAARSRMLSYPTQEAFHRNIHEQDIALDRYPDSPWGHLGQALALRVGIESGWMGGDLQAASCRADELAVRAVTLNQENYLAYYALARTLSGRNEMDRALSALEHAARLNPSSTLVLSGMVSPLLGLGRTRRALEVLAAAERINPLGVGELAYQKARTYWQMGAPDKALASLAAAPKDTTDHLKLAAVAHAELGNRVAARAALMRVKAKNPDWSVARERRAKQATDMVPARLHSWLARLAEAEMPA
ncbi:winged helix-turn-helix domain-containing protein [Salipiger mucosus]|uniref:Adenylate cyclase n=1 Tax=Salipiger mucosus DSM 16094 TaxID=1123237 RepID=S9QR95_9RHOB|nr:winged helix-turn-helix domain-containing protein [Salipiger mucosus]EPX83931.1 Adenylate cyclase [Salipiger mucosus DSM 16094]